MVEKGTRAIQKVAATLKPRFTSESLGKALGAGRGRVRALLGGAPPTPEEIDFFSRELGIPLGDWLKNEPKESE